jgi:HEAT repeat protein
MRWWVALLAIPVVGFQTPKETGGKMTSSELVERVKRKDWDLLMRQGLVGQGTGPLLLPLLNDPDPQVRELTVACLNEAGGPEAAEGLLKALHDKTDTVRASAARFLSAHYRAQDIPVIEVELESSRDAYVREQLALLLGRTGSATEIPVLRRCLPRERDEHSRHALSLAMARLGDPGHVQTLVSHLQQNDVAERISALQDLPYVNNRSLLAQAIPLLDDLRPGLNVGPSFQPILIRVCDVAVNVVNRMLGGRFPWVQQMKQYSPAEIAQVRAALSLVH